MPPTGTPNPDPSASPSANPSANPSVERSADPPSAAADRLIDPRRRWKSRWQGRWQGLLKQTRTRILLLQLLSMILIAAASIPLFLFLLLAEVDRRVQHDLNEALDEFTTAYTAWELAAHQSLSELQTFTLDYLSSTIPEDDNFLIFILDGQYYQSSPKGLPDVFAPNSQLMTRWIQEAAQNPDASLQPNGIQGKERTADPAIGTVLYRVYPLLLEGEPRGLFVAVHTTTGEQQEALAGAFILAQLALAIVVVALLIAWIMTGKLLAPLQNLTATVRSINQTDLSQRIAVRGTDELAELATTFNSMMDRLQTSFTSQRNFINDAGHELRTPITIILGHLEVMGDDPDEQQETHELVIDELHRMSRIVNDLILLSKSDRPDFLRLQPLELVPFTQALFVKSQALAQRDWRLTIQGAGEMIGDPQRLTGAIINLVNNAVQHTNDTDSIELGVKIGDRQVQFWVKDTGEGIALADQARIFERFARVDSQFRHSEGAGLGLAIVQAIVKSHGGHVELVSQLGQGARFTLILPLQPPHPVSNPLSN